MKAQVGRPRAYRAQGGVPIHISQRWVAPPTTSQVPGNPRFRASTLCTNCSVHGWVRMGPMSLVALDLCVIRGWVTSYVALKKNHLQSN